MDYCNECYSVEQGTIEIELDGETISVCACCQSTDETMVSVDEDAGQDR